MIRDIKGQLLSKGDTVVYSTCAGWDGETKLNIGKIESIDINGVYIEGNDGWIIYPQQLFLLEPSIQWC